MLNKILDLNLVLCVTHFKVIARVIKNKVINFSKLITIYILQHSTTPITRFSKWSECLGFAYVGLFKLFCNKI